MCIRIPLSALLFSGLLLAAAVVAMPQSQAVPAVASTTPGDAQVVVADDEVAVLRDWEFTRSRGNRCRLGTPGGF